MEPEQEGVWVLKNSKIALHAISNRKLYFYTSSRGTQQKITVGMRNLNNTCFFNAVI
jgi:hypothetical protein